MRRYKGIMAVMERLQAFKFELQPNGEQAQQMRRFAGSCRFVFNKALALQQTRHAQGEKKLSYAGLLLRNGLPNRRNRCAATKA